MKYNTTTVCHYLFINMLITPSPPGLCPPPWIVLYLNLAVYFN